MTLKVGDKVEVEKLVKEFASNPNDYIGEQGIIIDDKASSDYPYEVKFDNRNLETICFIEDELKKLSVAEEFGEEYYSIKFKRISVHDAANLLKSNRTVFYTREDSGNIL